MLLVIDFGSSCDPNILGTPRSGYGDLVKTRSFGLFRLVLYAISQLVTNRSFGYDPNILGTLGSGYGELVKTRGFGLFWPVLYAISH